VSTSRIGTWLAALVVVGGLIVVGGLSWEGWDGRFPDRSDPRLLAEGVIGDARWVVVLVHERDYGDCLYLREDGVLVDRWCEESSVLHHYQVGVRLLRGASQPILFGVLPAGTARAEVAADGGDTAPRFRKAAMIPVPVRTFGESGRYVVEPAPAGRVGSGPAWRNRNTAPIDLYDAQDRRLTP
jgi:hypothetical protein